MLKGLYDFAPVSPKTLGFKQNEKLLYLSPLDRDENWLRVSNSKGQIGLVPINYVDADCHVSGSSILDFLDESIQSARREKSPFISELQEIRRNILNPINDLEFRLNEFQNLIAQLKDKGSPYYNRSRVSRRSSQHTLYNDIEGDTNSNTPGSFLTCDDVQIHKQCSPSPTHCSPNTSSSRISVKSHRGDTSPLVQYVDSVHDNESQKCGRNSSGRGIDSFSRSAGSDDDNSMSSCRSSFTYTCRPVQIKSSASVACMKIIQPLVRGTTNEPSELREQKKLYELIQAVRQSTGASYDVSKTSVLTVLQYLRQQSVGNSESLEQMIHQLDHSVAAHRSDSVIRGSADYERLYLILTELSAHALDDELWEVQDSEVSENLIDEMKNILSEADKRIVAKALEEDDHQNVQNLTLYFQKESCWSRREKLIHCFAKIATINPKSLSFLLNSVLPLELAREMTDEPSGDTLNSHMETSASLLGLLLSTGEKLPVRHLDVLGKGFINFVLNKIDQCSTDSGSELANVLTNLVLAYNLQFGAHDENLTIAALATRQNAKFLTQKIVHLLLWEQDPIALIAAAAPNRQDSVLKLVLEMFSCSMTADLFYTNDTKVLIDIIVRCLMNWEPGERKRTVYLQLVRMIIRNSNFREHNHRKDDLVKMFTSILLEEDPLAIPDQRLIREITNEFPTLIK